jgi:hypothetical protein
MFSLDLVPTLAPILSPTLCLFRRPIPTPVPLSIHSQPLHRSIENSEAFSYPGRIVTIG